MKRAFDIAISILGITLLLPILVVTGLLIRINIGAPALFIQKRPGLNGKLFSLYKFRTMTNEKNIKGELLPDYLRLTTFGKIIRKLSADELPQLFNVLKGDMSFIGPRPLLERYLPYYTQRERKRHNVRPGITGLAQVKGRNKLNWDDRLELDVEYVEQHSLLLDIKILALTIIKVVKNKDVVVDPSSIMLDFDEERRRKEIRSNT